MSDVNVLEVVEVRETSSGSDITHRYCDICYPEDDTEVSLCGLDLSDEIYVESVSDEDWCAMCNMVLDSFPTDHYGRKLCPKGHPQLY